jgi:unsaturated rhamnogalacturonyl hydrolase
MTQLKPSAAFTYEGKTALDYANEACATLMRKFAAPDLPPKGRFHYHQGVFLSGMLKTYELTGDESLLKYVKEYVDARIDAYGNIYEFNPGMIDDLQPGILLFPLYDMTRDPRYKAALDTIAHYIRTCPQNPEGGIWHKAWYRGQMWLDGLYMAGPFSVEYGVRFGDDGLIDMAVNQARLMEEKTRVKESGLWRHAYDYYREQPWADKVTGLSPEFWGRSIGWVPVGLLDEIEPLPADHQGRAALTRVTIDLLRSLARYQDEKSGMWYQVVDKASRPDNWPETSCTSLYAAGICKAVRLSLLEETYLDIARKGVEGVLRSLAYDENGIRIGNVCVGTNVGDYTHYINRPTSVNDLHGVGAFLIMCAEAHRVL